jgi:hypothetical protein
VVRFNSLLTSIGQATYFGGSGDDVAIALAISATTGDVYVTGSTLSTDLPGTAGGAQAANAGGGGDAFVARLKSDLTAPLFQATYLGGSDGGEAGEAMAIHPTTGDVYVAGTTESTNFPGTAGGAQPANGTVGGGRDAFVARLKSDLTAPLLQATYLGGDGDEFAFGLAISPTTGNVYVTGPTNASDFPGTAGGAIDTAPGNGDTYVARLNSALTALLQATYLGGTGEDEARGLAINLTTGDVYVAGRTGSTDFLGTTGGAQPDNGGGANDAYVSRLTASLDATPASVPTLAEWAQVLLLVLLAASGVVVRRRRRGAA